MNKITERLSKHVADLGVLYVKLHNYHWHVEGMKFSTIHALTEGYYDEVTEAFDTIAERILQLGETAPASMGEYLKLAGIQEETAKKFTETEVVSKVKADFIYLAKELQETRIMAADSNDSTTDAILADIIQNLEKAVWMLGAMLK
ncbi:DNA starvation/stationary phase protection protein [Treponema phagedenis]|uniref:Antigen TyF1 n=1 Tax=Treponema phagedenis TaxID=162 RepID=A0A0B7GSH7_TREPH|nr:DNA starvation/stationary phase protection protein [Treponema phagedenis]EFW38008.1 ferritin-like protein [Treponema phagedenis F0421]NVP24372.1 DNA starvation/stationary phase protection protein [Treponema phagedenis]QEJ96067.1 DNA starvation/stationary phase protection protein [Treponema phagedenis]QEJ99034.1 DNA starvation/stationary phase protection protein [Treponema phagedenis]QEK01830.1 DNA starvation/stationary phase protection protein [Treponema phagedenis]